jgi:hypothetical protein
MQKAQLAAALVATLGFALGGTAFAANNDNGLNVSEKSTTKTEKSIKIAKSDKGTSEKGAEGSCKGKDGSCKGKDASCKGKEATCKGKDSKKKTKTTKTTKKSSSDTTTKTEEAPAK